MGEIYSILGWGSPIGTGLFLVLLGLFIYILSKADKNKKNKSVLKEFIKSKMK
jgi:hypothetical protein